MRNGKLILRAGLALPFAVLLMAALLPSQSAPQPKEMAAAHRGLDNLLRRPYGLPIMTRGEYDRLWTVWDPAWKARAEKDPSQIPRLTLARYGLTPSLDPRSDVPLQFVATREGLVMNCMSCHGGRVPGTGQVIAGMPNTEIDLPTMVEDLGKLRGFSLIPPSLLGQTRGRTNAVYATHLLLMYRNPDMSMRKDPVFLGKPSLFDMDAPAWWNVKKKKYLYCDALIQDGFVRTIMQFAMAANNGKALIDWEPDFQDILTYIDTLKPPKYPYPIDSTLAESGKTVFERNCAGCHGTYGANAQYPDRIVPIEQVGTDPVRLNGIPPEWRRYYATTWFAAKSRDRALEDKTVGYVAPPLEGVWATAPYFHNGSVPTLYGVLTAEARPKIFRRVGDALAFNRKEVGLQYETLTAPLPADLTSEQRRRIVDTSHPGLSNEGHPFGFHLTEVEKRQVIEYLKTL